MRLGYLRRKNAELPLFNNGNRRNGSRSPSPSRRVFSKKLILLGVFLFILLFLLLRPAGPRPKRRETKTRFDAYFNAREDLFNDRLFFIKSVASICTNLPKNSSFWGETAARYSTLGMDENISTSHKYFFALRLKDSSNHLPTIIDNLLRVIYHIGEKNVFMSIYEGGSTDGGHTTAMVDVIKTTMDAIGLEYHVTTDSHSSDQWNPAVEPLKSMYRSSGRIFNTVVMMNDDLWCAEELLESIYQSRRLGAHVTCSTDVRVNVDDDTFSISPGFDVEGVPFEQSDAPSWYIPDEDSSRRFRNNYPVRVQSCSSSITIIDPTPYYPPYDFTFKSSALNEEHRASPWETRCGFSPELDMAVWYSAAGFDRQILIPRTQTGKTLLQFYKDRRTEAELASREQLHRQLGVWVPEDDGGKVNPFGKSFDQRENDDVFQSNRKVANKFQCKASKGIEWIQLRLPETFESGVGIDRKLPVLE